MRMLITMSRNWDDDDAFFEALDRYWLAPLNAGSFIIVHGDEPEGEGRLVRTYLDMARNGNIEIDHEPYPADWSKGRRAGLERNLKMVNLGADLCHAWIMPCSKPGCRRSDPHGSHGATHCRDAALTAGIRTISDERWNSTKPSPPNPDPDR